MPATDKYWRNVKTVHVVFAASAVLLFVATVWMMWADHDDEWREYQKTFFEIEAAKLEASLADVKPEDYPEMVKEKQERIDQVTEELRQQEDVQELRDKVREWKLAEDLANRDEREAKTYQDVARANYDLAISQGKEQKAAELFEVFQQRKAEAEQAVLARQEAEANLEKAQTRLNRATQKRDELQAELKALRSDVDRLESAIAQVDPELGESPLRAIKRPLMELPIIDGFNSHLKVYQDWLPDLKIQLGMARVARFDRCRTCHRAADRIESGNAPSFPFGHPDSPDVKDWVRQNRFPRPFATHPRPELYLTAASPHPVQQFGCTICHDGQGSATDFRNAEHTANDPHVAEIWEEEHHYHPNHFWEYPMLPQRFQEASCVKCHHSVVELGIHPEFGASAPKVYKGFQLVKQFGCFGCHEIHGYESGNPIGPDIRLEPGTEEERQSVAADPSLIAGTMRKVGPSLRHVANKTSLAWLEYWTEEPKRFRPTTRMPQFFKLTNQADLEKIEETTGQGEDVDFNHLSLKDLDDESAEFTPVELASLSTYLLDKSQPLNLLKPASDYQPDAGRGKTAFKRRGCLGCHSHKAFPGATAGFGPDLSRVYAKVKRDPGNPAFSNWLYTWIRDPQRHHSRSRMPQLFFDDEENVEGDPVADVVAFLLQDDGEDRLPDFAAYPLNVDGQALDDLVRLHLSKTLAKRDVDRVLDSRKYPTPADRIRGDEIELASSPSGEAPDDDQWRTMKLNYVGRRTISRYGCYGCHDIPGFEEARPIGTTLQDWGRKDTSKLAFEHIVEYLEEFGEPDGASTDARVKDAMQDAHGDEFTSEAQEEAEMRAAYFYDSLRHHSRPGFIWQKLRQPRSYDYKKTNTKGYDERLRMPRFQFSADPAENEAAIEAIATFVLGLVADPPAARYLFQPEGPSKARIEGELLLDKYNCTGCHMVDLPEVTYAFPQQTPGLSHGMRDFVGSSGQPLEMTRDDLVEWFVQHAGGLSGANGADSVDVPAPVQLVLENTSDLLDPQPDLVELAKAGADQLQQKYGKLSQDDLEELAKNLTAWTDASAELAEMPADAATSQDAEVKQQFEMLSKQASDLRKAALSTILKNQTQVWLGRLTKLAAQGEDGAGFQNWLNEHDEVLIASRLGDGEFPDGLRQLLKLKYPRPAKNAEKFLNPLDFSNWLLLSESDELEGPRRERVDGQTARLGQRGVDRRDLRLMARRLAGQDPEEVVYDPEVDDPEILQLRAELLELFEQHQAALTDVLGQPTITFRGLVFRRADPEEFLIDQEHSFDLWETLDLEGRYVLPQEKMLVPQIRMAREKPARGGQFAEWLVDDLIADSSHKAKGDRFKAWQSAPPTLYQEGLKVQTPWLYRFLKDPHRIRWEVVLRMPKFNMSDEEAMALANYFAAADGADYPYQRIPQREPEYLEQQEQAFHREFGTDETYLTEAWNVLNGKLCIGCHAVGGREFRAPDPAQVTHGPDLNRVHDRLRPEWVTLWLYKPQWITPYTGMPAPFPRNQMQFPDLFDGEPKLQTKAARDALFNYARLIETLGKYPSETADAGPAVAPKTGTSGGGQ